LGNETFLEEMEFEIDRTGQGKVRPQYISAISEEDGLSYYIKALTICYLASYGALGCFIGSFGPVML
jgi:hypothetical protein